MELYDHNIFMMTRRNYLYEKAIKYGAKFQENENSSQVSLFGESSDVQIENHSSMRTGVQWKN
jgi:hypothetical protein